MSALGLFDVKGLTEINPQFQVGAPLFDKVTIRLNKDYYPGKEFIIETKKSAADNCYVQSVQLNGKSQNSIQIPFESVIKGGKLTLQLDSTPNKDITD